MPLDDDGFAIQTDPVMRPVLPPPPMVEIPKFFDGCHTADEATVRMINALAKTASIQVDGWDEMYRRLANALIMVLANQVGLAP